MPSPLKVLIVEDSREDAALMVRELSRQGFSVDPTQVESLATIAAALGSQPDIVLVDFSVPGLTFADVMRTLRDKLAFPPVIVVSGKIGEDAAADTIREGALDYVMKDRLGRLGPAVERVLREVELHRQARQVEEELRLRNLAFSAIRDGVLIAAYRPSSHQIVDCNPAFEQISGYTRQELVGQPLQMLEGAETDRTVSDALHAAIESASPFHGELTLYRKDGHTFSNDLSLQPFTDHDGQVTRFVAVCRDVTPLRSAEARAAQHLALLAHSERFKTVGEMAAGLAHELNQPLTAIAVQSEIAKTFADRLSGSDREIFTKSIDAVSKQSHRAGEIIRLLREMIQRAEPVRSLIAISTIISEVLKLIEPDLRRQQIQIRCEIASNLPILAADRIQLEQVLLNLLRNSADAVKDQSKDRRTICVQSGADNASDSIWVTVSDQGPGIDDSTFSRIFETFFTTKPQGLGMGLAISRSIIEAHHGQLSCQERGPQGTTFRFELPLTG